MTGTLRNAVTEALATMLFVFIIVAAVNADVNAPLAIGLGLMALVYATGHLSGAHLNPAVSVGAFLRGALGAVDLAAYIVAQLIGGALGALLSMAVWSRPAAAVEIEIGPAFLLELIFTFVLVLVVLNVATSKDHPNNSFYGLAIGATVFVGATTVGPITGGGFNPAVALGLVISGQFDLANLWLYVLAPVAGAILAAVVFRLLNRHDLLKVEA